jgi:hypothetical protein
MDSMPVAMMRNDRIKNSQADRLIQLNYAMADYEK